MSENDGEFDSFFRQEYPRIVLQLATEGLELQAAKDATQEAMVQAYANWEEILIPKAWVRKVAQRIAWRTSHRNEMRRQKEEKDNSANRRSREPGPEERATISEEYQEVLRTLQSLTSTQRYVMALLFDGYTTREVAQKMGVSGATVRSHIRHARQRLGSRPGAVVAQEVVVTDER
ncbi:RNA polymerase sigma factor [Streptomyces iakyrus]|uniref:RNA polymerase sigma factor n=1 Tax=Streptomyces iakyrus TaxID=68219 RepID=UPI003688E62B